VKAEVDIINVNRSAAQLLSGEVAKRFGHAGLPRRYHLDFPSRHAGQAFGAGLRTALRSI